MRAGDFPLRDLHPCLHRSRAGTGLPLPPDAQHLDAQYDASQAYIRSQAHAGWTPVRSKYDEWRLRQPYLFLLAGTIQCFFDRTGAYILSPTPHLEECSVRVASG